MVAAVCESEGNSKIKKKRLILFRIEVGRFFGITNCSETFYSVVSYNIKRGGELMGDPYYSGDILFQIVPIFIGIIFIIVFGSILFTVFKGIGQWKKNEQSPRLSVPAEVKTKRTHVRRVGQDGHSSTSYFVTFEFSSGDRSELKMSGKEFGYLAEGDVGILTFQGTRFLEFERKQQVEDET